MSTAERGRTGRRGLSAVEACSGEAEAREPDPAVRATRGQLAGQGAAGELARLIDGRIKELNDWHGEMLTRIRDLIKQADPDVVEEWKWRGVPVWSRSERIIPTS